MSPQIRQSGRYPGRRNLLCRLQTTQTMPHANSETKRESPPLQPHLHRPSNPIFTFLCPSHSLSPESGAKQQPATRIHAPTHPAPDPHSSAHPPPPVPIDTSWKASSRFRVPPGPTSVCKSPPPPEPPPPPKPAAPAPPVRRSLHCQHPAQACPP